MRTYNFLRHDFLNQRHYLLHGDIGGSRVDGRFPFFDRNFGGRDYTRLVWCRLLRSLLGRVLPVFQGRVETTAESGQVEGGGGVKNEMLTGSWWNDHFIDFTVNVWFLIIKHGKWKAFIVSVPLKRNQHISYNCIRQKKKEKKRYNTGERAMEKRDSETERIRERRMQRDSVWGVYECVWACVCACDRVR